MAPERPTTGAPARAGKCGAFFILFRKMTCNFSMKARKVIPERNCQY